MFRIFHYEPSKGLLFQTMNDSTLTISKIAVYDLNGSYTTYNGKKMFSPKDMITFDMHNTHTKYEVESLGWMKTDTLLWLAIFT